MLTLGKSLYDMAQRKDVLFGREVAPLQRQENLFHLEIVDPARARGILDAVGQLARCVEVLGDDAEARRRHTCGVPALEGFQIRADGRHQIRSSFRRKAGADFVQIGHVHQRHGAFAADLVAGRREKSAAIRQTGLSIDAGNRGAVAALGESAGDPIVLRQVAQGKRGFVAGRQGYGQRTDALSRRESAHDDREARSFVFTEQLSGGFSRQFGTVGVTGDRACGEKNRTRAVHLKKEIGAGKCESQKAGRFNHP